MRFLAALLLVAGCQHTDVAEQSAKVTSKAAPAPAVAPAPALAEAPPPGVTCGCSAGGQCGAQCGGGCMSAQAPAPEWGAVPEGASWTPLHVTGMHCGGCAKRIERALHDVKGVLAVKVDLGAAKVEVATAAGVDARAVAKPAIDGLGYRVE